MDRHLVHAIAPEFHSEKEVVDWLTERGAVLKLVDCYDDECNIYHAIADMDKYKQYCDTMSNAKGPIGMDESMTEAFMSFNNIEIHKDGSYHIVY